MACERHVVLAFGLCVGPRPSQYGVNAVLILRLTLTAYNLWYIYWLVWSATHTHIHTCTEREGERELLECRVGLLSCSWPGFMPDHWHSYLHICWAAGAAALAGLLYLNVLNFKITFYQQNYRMVSQRKGKGKGNERAKARQGKAKSWPRMTTAGVLAVSLLHCNLNLCNNFQL